jgi:NAD(P)-dependent dehydrogenase (short-subunit alcohol dehydrogenase family)
MDLKLTEHVAVVTGASKGIGLAITRTLLDEGKSATGESEQRDAGDAPAAHQIELGLHVRPAAPRRWSSSSRPACRERPGRRC